MAVLVGLALCGHGASPAGGAAPVEGPPTDTFTSVVVSTLGRQTAPVLGTDGKYHVMYELMLVNSKAPPATLQRLSVLDASDHSRVLAAFEGDDVVGHTRTLLPGPATDGTIESNGARFFFVELTFRAASDVPRRVVHRLDLLAAAGPGARASTPLTYTVAPFDIRGQQVPRMGPPLKGRAWVAANGCCTAAILHRGSVLSINGGFFDAQRYAIDWMRLDDQGRFVHGDPSKAENYTAYGADVIAVDDAAVVDALDELDDQVPGQLPDPNTITVRTVDGNHVVLDLGAGYYAFYAHLQKGSVRVKVGDKVKRGQLLGKLGNSGNTSAPHLHFHVMRGASVLGSDGAPYVIDAFQLSGQVDAAQFDAAPTIEGQWGQDRLDPPVSRQRAYPLDLNIVDFPS